MDTKKPTNKVNKTSTCANSLDTVLKQIEDDYHLCKDGSTDRNKDQPDRQYCCGACMRKFKTICRLHYHLQISHRAGGSYHYDHYLRTAFPKYDTFCRFTQTTDVIDEDSDDKQYLSNGDPMSTDIGSTLDKSCSLLVTDKEQDECMKQTNPDATVLSQESNTHTWDTNESKPSLVVAEQIQNNKSGHNLFKEESAEKFQNNEIFENKKDNSSDGCDKEYMSDKTDDYFDEDDDDKYETVESVETISETNDNTGKSNTESRSQKRKQPNPRSIKMNIISKSCEKIIKVSNTTTASKTEAINVESKPLVDPIPDANCSCDICGAKFSLKRCLLRHEQVKHLHEMKHNCQFCDKKFMREYNLNKHIKFMHTTKPGVKTRKSNSAVKRKLDQSNKMTKSDTTAPETNDDKLDSNIKVKTPETDEAGSKTSCKKKEEKSILKTPHTCDICGLTMPSSKIEVHQRLHSGERPYICDLCGKGLISQSKLKRHMLIHAEKKRYTCETCGVGFQMKYKLRMHQHIHTGKKPYLCSICGAEFNHSSNLATHTRCVHLQIKPYECSTCGRKYSKRSQLDDHLLSHTTQKQFVCRFCGKSFKYHKGMQRHEKSHTEDKHFPCNQCECTFSRKDNLERHKQSHQVVMLECKLCKKMFKDEKLLHEHEFFHLGRKKFLCVVCGESYKLANQYHTHMLAAHGIEQEKATQMHEEEIQNKANLTKSVFQEPAGQIDPNLPLRLDDESSESETVQAGEAASSSGTCVNQIVTGLLEDSRAAINVLTRVATENLRLHCEDIHEEEKLNVIVPPLNPMILLERNQAFSSIPGAPRLSVTSESSHSEPSGSQSHSSMQITSSSQIPHHSINQPINRQHESNTRLSQDSRSNFNNQISFSQNNGAMSQGDVASTYSVQDARLTLENLARQHDSVSVPLTLIRLSENTMDPAGQPQSTESQEQNNRQSTLDYRIQNMY